MDAMKAALKKAGVRPERIRLLGLPGELVASLCHSLQARNEIFWMPATMEPPELQFDFNQEWIQSGFELGRY